MLTRILEAVGASIAETIEAREIIIKMIENITPKMGIFIVIS